jgi:hypothetical protein
MGELMAQRQQPEDGPAELTDVGPELPDWEDRIREGRSLIPTCR